MESSWTQDLLNWIAANPGWSGFLVFLIAFVESLLVIGFLIPGIFILFGIGAVIGLGGLDMWPIWVGGTLGALAGDILSFWIGRRYRAHLADFWPFTRYPELLHRGKDFFSKHGSKSVVAGRFIGPLRPIIPATAGMLGMKPARFNMVCIPACILWTPAYLVPGMLFGASLEVASEYAGRLSLLLAALVAALWLTFWALRSLYVLATLHSARWMRHAIRWSRRHPVLGRFIGPIVDPSRPEALSVAMMGLLLVVTLWGFAFLLFLSPFGAQPQEIDQAMLAWAQSLRNHIADPFMVAVTQVSRWWVLVPTAVATLLWLIGAQRFSAAIHWLVAMAGGIILHYLADWSLRSTPAMEEASSAQWFVPSAAMTLTTVVLVFFCVMVAKELKRRSRKWPYLVCALTITLLFASRLYFGLDWLSGALVGTVLGLSWTAIVGIAYRQRRQRRFSGPVACAIFFGTLALTMAWQVQERLQEDLQAYRLPLPARDLALESWWQSEWSSLPAERTRWQSVQARRFNLQVGADLGDFQAALESQGWEASEPPGIDYLLQALNPTPTESSLPLLGKDFLGRQEALVMRYPSPDPDRQQVLRLWDSGARLQPGERPLYLGQFSNDELIQRVRLFSFWRGSAVSDSELAQMASLLYQFEVQNVIEDALLLIRPDRPVARRQDPPPEVSE